MALCPSVRLFVTIGVLSNGYHHAIDAYAYNAAQIYGFSPINKGRCTDQGEIAVEEHTTASLLLDRSSVWVDPQNSKMDRLFHATFDRLKDAGISSSNKIKI